MQPLSPRDLLIRQNPADLDQWLEEGQSDENDKTGGTVSLERFQTLEHVIRDSPLTADPYLELARIYLKSRRWVDARRVLDKAFERFSDNEEVNFLREEAQLARSLELYSAAEKEHHDEPTSLTQDNLDRSRVELNVLRERVCKGRLERDPEQLELYLPLAMALENLGQIDEAIAALEKPVAEPNLRAAAALQLGGICERCNRVPEALSAYRRAAMFREPPPSTEIKLRALQAAADLAENSMMIDSARRYVEMLLELQPGDAELIKRMEDLRNTPI